MYDILLEASVCLHGTGVVVDLRVVGWPCYRQKRSNLVFLSSSSSDPIAIELVLDNATTGRRRTGW